MNIGLLDLDKVLSVLLNAEHLLDTRRIRR